MWRLAGRNAVAVGAALAALLLTMQLRTEGVRGYEPADVLSILLFAVPTALQKLRPARDRRGRPRERAPDDATGAAPRPDEAVAPVARTPLNERALVIERLVVYGVTVVIAAGSYVLLVLLVLLQAWIPALSTMMVCGIALAGIPSRDAAGRHATSTPDGSE